MIPMNSSKMYPETLNNEEFDIKLLLFTAGGKGRIAADSSTSVPMLVQYVRMQSPSMHFGHVFLHLPN
jgi:hypothetical protein